MQEPPHDLRRGKRSRLRPHTTTSGILLAAVATPIGVVAGNVEALVQSPRWLLATGAAGALLFCSAAWTIVASPRLGRTLATLGIFAALGLITERLLADPSLALAALVGTTVTLTLLWKVGSPLIGLSRTRRRPLCEGQAQGAGIAALGIWLAWPLASSDATLGDTIVVGWAFVCAGALGCEWGLRNLSSRRLAAAALLLTIGGAAVLLALSWGAWWWMMTILSGPAAVGALVVRSPVRHELDKTSWWEPLLGRPERLLVGTFVALCLGGTVLLALPQSTRAGVGIGFADAAFTSTSAACVTGLSVRDTATVFNTFGQLAILALIQLGGLGIMTFSTAALWALGRRMSLRHEGAVASLISTQDRGRLFDTTKGILQLTFVAEALGTGVLYIAFSTHGDAPGSALWRALFTSISAFCNAGFALQSDSLIPYQQAPLVLHTVGLLIIVGGISPLAVFTLPALARRSAQPIAAQARLCLSSAAILVVAGFLCILAFEWQQSLAGLSVTDKLHNAWFQSITLRTAGFNSVDIAMVRPATFTLMLLWMFIGGSPGGTAGGVKTTTLAILVLSAVQAIRGQWTLETFGKRISERTRAKAAVIVVVAAATGLAALLAIQLTQRMSSRAAVFEVVSALGTVGLSLGGTAELDGIGKAVIIACMFVGRVGGLTLLMFLSSRQAAPTLGHPEEEIDVG